MSRGSQRFARGLIAAFALLSALLCAPGAFAAANDPSPAQAITELNAWRATLGESVVSTTDVPSFDTGCTHHVQYMQDNNLLTHPEQGPPMPAPGYTPDGAVAGPDSVLAEERSSPAPAPEPSLLPGPVWDSAVFHRAALLQPRLAQVGFNSTTFQSGNTFTSWQCLWDQNGPSEPPPLAIDKTRTTPALTLYPSPGNGAFGVPTTFPAGTESPDPGAESGVNGATLGWLINVELNGPWDVSGGGGVVWAHGVTATLENDATKAVVPTVVSQCGTSPCGLGTSTPCSEASGGTALGCYFGGGFGILPLQALAGSTTYHVQVSGTVADTNGSDPPFTKTFSTSWCFSTGPTYTPSADCSATNAAGVEPLVPGTLTATVTGQGTVAGSGISCPTTCSQSLLPGTSVTLTETPASGHKFVGWSGGGCSGTATTCTTTVNEAETVAATFGVIPPPQTGAPTLSGSSLTLGTRTSKLALTVNAGKNAHAVKSLVISLPNGLSFSSKSKKLRKGLKVGGHLAFTASVRGSLTITLTSPASSVQISASKPLLTATKALLRAIAHHKVKTLTFRIVVTDSAGVRTTLKAVFSPR